MSAIKAVAKVLIEKGLEGCGRIGRILTMTAHAREHAALTSLMMKNPN